MITAGIAGIGWITPLGRDLEFVRQAIYEDKRPPALWLENPISKKCVPILRVPEELLRECTTLPRLRRSSVISHLAVAAVTDAVSSARLTPDQLGRTALIFAASDGGVIYTRRFFSIVERGGERAVRRFPGNGLQRSRQPHRCRARLAWRSAYLGWRCDR